LKFLIIRFSSIGDIVLTSPVVRCLKKHFPDSEIHFLTKVQFHQLLVANPNINKIHLLEDNLSTTIESLKPEKYDAVIDLHKNIRSKKVIKALGILSYSFDKLNLDKWLVVNLKINRLPRKSIVDRYFEGLELLNIKNDGEGLDYYINEKEVYENVMEIGHAHNYIAFAIGATYFTKRLPENKIAALCEKINDKIILLGGKTEEAAGERLNSQFPTKIINFCGKINLNESAWLVKNAKKVISHDTGIMHIAAAFKKPIASIWGNTIPEFGMYPYFGKKAKEAEEKSRVFEVQNLYCRPCSKLGHKQCPEGHFRCMNDINLDEVAAWVNG